MRGWRPSLGTLPSSSDPRPVPRLPTTNRSASCSWATAISASAGSPRRAWVTASSPSARTARVAFSQQRLCFRRCLKGGVRAHHVELGLQRRGELQRDGKHLRACLGAVRADHDRPDRVARSHRWARRRPHANGDAASDRLRWDQGSGRRFSQRPGKPRADSPFGRELDDKLDFAAVKPTPGLADALGQPNGLRVVGPDERTKPADALSPRAVCQAVKQRAPKPRRCQSSATVTATSAISASSLERI